jgi:hypothetical protein
VELVLIQCERCGASLEVERGDESVTCKHCKAHHAVRDERSPQQMLVLQGEIERLDREWATRTQTPVPLSGTSAVLVAVELLLFCALVFVALDSSLLTLTTGCVLFVGLLVVPMVIAVIQGRAQQTLDELTQAAHDAEREELVEKLESLREKSTLAH